MKLVVVEFIWLASRISMLVNDYWVLVDGVVRLVMSVRRGLVVYIWCWFIIT